MVTTHLVLFSFLNGAGAASSSTITTIEGVSGFGSPSGISYVYVVPPSATKLSGVTKQVGVTRKDYKVDGSFI